VTFVSCSGEILSKRFVVAIFDLLIRIPISTLILVLCSIVVDIDYLIKKDSLNGNGMVLRGIIWAPISKLPLANGIPQV
jgi:hypothetical protein